MLKILNSNCIYSFSKENKPIAKVKSGDSVEFYTMDCFGEQVKSMDDKLEAIDWNKINPATGSVYIENVMPGDVLKVTIEKIEIGNQAVIATGENLGVLGDKLEGMTSRILPIENDEIIFDHKLRIPLKKMIGVIGVAPEGEGINCGTPGEHGGNMDNAMIGEGATLYFPVFVEGGLFALGDLHAVMGDGEISVTGAEASGRVQVKLEVVKGIKINSPLLENDEIISTIASKETLDEAVDASVHQMAELLKERVDMSLSEIAMLLSLVGNTEICQVVDPLKTARFNVPKWVLEKYSFKLY
ncbi:acetamidase/formamidase family protein [Clostridium sp. MSJ-11]|uniref:Acetamidase/formamidase family protein n=1 Tax=Clostridium mobile TaxID=2841512 RepID=A0ABS6EKV4_9CLOT|nr:acetamidase/formamidase family protein [Clostridium mobile]MBU5485834.1 acetamidase/formamidase family protein [Clostridium mobile]